MWEAGEVKVQVWRVLEPTHLPLPQAPSSIPHPNTYIPLYVTYIALNGQMPSSPLHFTMGYGGCWHYAASGKVRVWSGRAILGNPRALYYNESGKEVCGFWECSVNSCSVFDRIHAGCFKLAAVDNIPKGGKQAPRDDLLPSSSGDPYSPSNANGSPS